MMKTQHLRELARVTGMNQTTTKRKVEWLVGQNIIDFRVEGRNHVFFVKDSLEAAIAVKAAEHLKLIRVLKAYPRLRLILERILAEPDITSALLFGSCAREQATKHSDIDVFIETSDRAIRDRIALLDTKLHMQYGKFEKNSVIGQEIIRNHVILKGVDRFYGLIHQDAR